MGATYSQSILGEVPAKLRQQVIRKNHQGIFKADTRKTNHHSVKAQFIQADIENTRYIKEGFQRMKSETLSHLSSIDVDSHSNTDKTLNSRTAPGEKRFAYNNQDLMALCFHSPASKEIQQVCARTNSLLDGSRPKARTCPPVGLSPCSTHHPLVPLPPLDHRKRYRSKDKGGTSGNSKRFSSAPKEIGGHLSTFSAPSLRVPLKINQGKRKCTFEDKVQPLKRQNSPRPGAEFLFSGFSLVVLIIVGLWRLLLYNCRMNRQGSLASPTPIGSSEVVPQQPSSQP